MCEPISMMIGLGIASAGLNYMASSSVNNQNASSAASWANQQRNYRAQENARQESMRLQAEKSRQQSVEQLNPDVQKDARVVEEERLTQDYSQAAQLPGDNITAGNVTDQAFGADLKYSPDSVKADRAASINAATAESRKRIAALAAVQSYGKSQFGMENRSKQILGESGNAIDMQNLLKKGSLGAYQTETQIQPQRYTVAPWVGLATGVANAAAGAFGGKTGYNAGFNQAQQFAANQPAGPTFQPPQGWTQ